jgi:hypothetical protein
MSSSSRKGYKSGNEPTRKPGLGHAVCTILESTPDKDRLVDLHPTPHQSSVDGPNGSSYPLVGQKTTSPGDQEMHSPGFIVNIGDDVDRRVAACLVSPRASFVSLRKGRHLSCAGSQFTVLISKDTRPVYDGGCAHTPHTTHHTPHHYTTTTHHSVGVCLENRPYFRAFDAMLDDGVAMLARAI